jgi:hypothetical protein
MSEARTEEAVFIADVDRTAERILSDGAAWSVIVLVDSGCSCTVRLRWPRYNVNIEDS